MFQRSIFILTSALSLNFTFMGISANPVKAQCYNINDVQCWLDEADRALENGNQLVDQMHEYWVQQMNLCPQGDEHACQRIMVNSSSPRQQQLMQQMYDMKSRSLQDTACMPYCN
jgi:hypothetical protein